MIIDSIIYYKVDDNAFQRAARTIVVKDGIYRVMFEVKTKQDFLDAWKNTCDQATAINAKIGRLHLLTHASKGTQQDGLEFAALNGQSGTLTFDEMIALPKVPWSGTDNELILYGCNTGIRGTRGWCPAEHLAQTQKIKTTGEHGYAYFSTELEDYDRITDSDLAIYLHAYYRSDNSSLPFGLGDGNIIPAESFTPYLSASVGDGGANNLEDLKFVQKSLNLVPAAEGGPSTPLDEDGLIGPATIAAIKSFQQQQFGFQDGKIDPDGKTLTKLITFRPVE